LNLPEGTYRFDKLHDDGIEALSLLLDTKRLSVMSQILFMTERTYPSRGIRTEGDGFSGSHWTGRFGLLPLLEQLINRKYEIDQRDDSGRTPLSWAAENGREAIVKLLLDTGKVDVDSKNNNGRTPLSHAAQGGHEKVAKLLLEKTHAIDLAGATRTECDIEAMGLTSVQSMPKCHLDLFGRTHSMWAALGGHISLIQSLWPSHLPVSYSALTQTDSLGLSFIHLFAIGNCAEVVNLVLYAGFDVNKTDSQAWTPLHWAAYFGH
jgi:ankyrin repeat protein